ncbi:MAG: YxlC family protein [Gorillibacterium sp.]|nr:YxlC family protein [Gorillibacterium sp.]
MKWNYNRKLQRGRGNPSRLLIPKDEAVIANAYASIDKAEPVILPDEEIALLISQELKVFDESYVIPKPNLYQLEAVLAEHKRKLTRKLRRELMFFLLVAVFILSSSAALLVRLPSVFLTIQVICVLFPLIFLFLPQRTRDDRRWRP